MPARIKKGVRNIENRRRPAMKSPDRVRELGCKPNRHSVRTLFLGRFFVFLCHLANSPFIGSARTFSLGDGV